MRTLAAVAHGLADSLLTRAADVMLKERRRLVLLARETPLHLGHLRNMVSVTEMGAIVCPPCPRSTCTRAAWTTSWTHRRAHAGSAGPGPWAGRALAGLGAGH
jgi:flavoprotein